MIELKSLDVETSIRLVQGAIAAGAELGVAVSVAVCAPSMDLIAFGKGDGATPHSAETSRRKAQTAASTRRATGWMPAGLAIELPMASGNMLTNIPGGIPIQIDGEFVGAIGIAGGTVVQDAAIANSTIEAIGACSKT